MVKVKGKIDKKVKGVKENKVKVEEKKETPYWKRFLIMLGLFILTIGLYTSVVSLFILEQWTWGWILFLLGIAANIFIFVKGRKGAVILGVFLLIGAIISVLGVGLLSFFFNGGGLQELSLEEQNQILASKGENIENLFYGFANKNYTIFSRDLNDKMKGRYDMATFSNLYDSLGKISLRNCSTAARTKTGYDVILCEVEAQNKKTSWDIRFDENSTIWGLYIEDIYPNVTATIKSNKTADSINIRFNGARTQLNAGENQVLLILNVAIRSNENETIRIHGAQFLNEKYTYDLISEKYVPIDCSLIRNIDIKSGEVKEGCLIFSVYEDYQGGTIRVL